MSAAKRLGARRGCTVACPHVNGVRMCDLHPSVGQQVAQLLRDASRRDHLERRLQLVLDVEGGSRLRRRRRRCLRSRTGPFGSWMSWFRRRIVELRIETHAGHLHALPLLEVMWIGGEGQQLLDRRLLDIVDGVADLDLDEVHVQAVFQLLGPPRLRSAVRDSLAFHASAGLLPHGFGFGRLDVPPE